MSSSSKGPDFKLLLKEKYTTVLLAKCTLSIKSKKNGYIHNIVSL